MNSAPAGFSWKNFILLGLFSVSVLAIGMALGAHYLGGLRRPLPGSTGSVGTPVPNSEDEDDPPKIENYQVRVVQPRTGATEHNTVQPGSILAKESADLYSKVSGYLKEQRVNIGDRVKKGQILAIVDIPELEKRAERCEAVLEQSRAHVLQMKARAVSAEAEIDAAGAQVIQSEAAAKSASAWVRFRGLQYQRMKDLFASKSIEERLVDEAKERFEASIETERSTVASISTAKAQLASAKAKLMQAEADIAVAEAEVKVAQATLGESKILVESAIIRAPFDGVISYRGIDPGGIIRSEGSGQKQILTVQRNDIILVIVYVPDRDVPYTDPGDPAIVEIDAFPGEKFHGKVVRRANSEDPKTRLMRVEIDLPNPTGKICEGMYGRVTILLDKSSDRLSIPSSCLAGRAEGGKGMVFIVREGKAFLTKVQLGIDNGNRVEVLRGLTGNDLVILQPGNALKHGMEVETTAVMETITEISGDK